MSTAEKTFSKGLEGIIAAQTEMSFINGTEGILEYVGIAIGDLASQELVRRNRLPALEQTPPKHRANSKPSPRTFARTTRCAMR